MAGVRLQRVFIALPVPPQTASELLAQATRQLPPNGATVAPENLHITLAFLGNITEATLAPLGDGLQRLSGLLPQHIRLDAIAPFPNPQGKTLAAWAVPTPALCDLFHGVKTLLGALSLRADERDRFLPHITLARQKTARAIQPQPLDDRSSAFVATTLGIYEGCTTAQGYRYQCLWSIDRSAGSSCG